MPDRFSVLDLDPQEAVGLGYLRKLLTRLPRTRASNSSSTVKTHYRRWVGRILRGYILSTITKVDRPAVATNCNLGCRICVGVGRLAMAVPDLCRAIDSRKTPRAREVITVGDADARYFR